MIRMIPKKSCYSKKKAVSGVIGRTQLFLSRLRLPCSYFLKRGKTNSTGKKSQENGNKPQGFRNLFGKYLYITNTVASAALMSLADLLQQEIENYNTGKPRHTYDWIRNIHMTEFGAIQGCLSHFFYMILDRCMPGTEMSTIAKKLLIDQGLFAPFCICIFIVGLRWLNGNFAGSWLEIQEKFFIVYMVDCIVWIPTQFINFYLLPPRFRVLYLSVISVLYNMFLSFVKHNNISF